jgi:dihydrofolate reductase
MANRVRAFLATSLDGFIAGPNDELDWLPGHAEGGSEDTFTPFFAEIGALLMGRRTFDVVSGFGGEWPYGETPILVASSRPLGTTRPSVRRIEGPVGEMIEEARRVAGDRDRAPSCPASRPPSPIPQPRAQPPSRSRHQDCIPKC